MRFSLVALVVSATAVLAAPAPESNANPLEARATILCDRTTKNNCPADCLASYHGTPMNCAKSVVRTCIEALSMEVASPCINSEN